MRALHYNDNASSNDDSSSVGCSITSTGSSSSSSSSSSSKRIMTRRRRFVRDGLLSRARSCSSVSSSTTASAEGQQHQDEPDQSKLSATVALGAGCFWKTRQLFEQVLPRTYPGTAAAIKSIKLGYMSPYETGVASEPTFEQVHCGGKSGHVEVALIEFDYDGSDSELRREELFANLVRFFFQCHDATSKYRQGPHHRGFQFSSWVFCSDDAQHEIVKDLKCQFQSLLDSRTIPPASDRKVKTGVSSRMRTFTEADPTEIELYLSEHPEENDDGADGEDQLRFKSWPVVAQETVVSKPTRRGRFCFRASE